jgi:cell division septation protein DedD
LGLFAAAVILVVVAGGAAAFYLRGSESAPSGPPPVIAADQGAVRVEPSKDQQASTGETVGDAVYNRVAGTTPPADEHVVDNAEEPKEVARIVLPQSQSNSADTVVSPVGGDNDAATSSGENPPPASDQSAPAADATAAQPAPAPAPAASDEIGPRRVPTFVVKADGSIVATGDAGAPAPDPAAAQDQQLAGETQPIEPVPVATVSIAEANAPAAAASPAKPLSAAAKPAKPPAMETRPTIDEPPADVATPAPAPAAPAAADAAAAPDQATVASAEPAAAPPAPAAGGGFFVQLSSEGSMADAQSTYGRAQQKFPAVLGKLDPQIQQADLGAKGVFYRVRVGPWGSRKEAVDLCESLKAAGGNCFVAK